MNIGRVGRGAKTNTRSLLCGTTHSCSENHHHTVPQTHNIRTYIHTLTSVFYISQHISYGCRLSRFDLAQQHKHFFLSRRLTSSGASYCPRPQWFRTRAVPVRHRDNQTLIVTLFLISVFMFFGNGGNRMDTETIAAECEPPRQLNTTPWCPK